MQKIKDYKRTDSFYQDRNISTAPKSNLVIVASQYTAEEELRKLNEEMLQLITIVTSEHFSSNASIERISNRRFIDIIQAHMNAK